jgi:hypothetical protein
MPVFIELVEWVVIVWLVREVVKKVSGVESRLLPVNEGMFVSIVEDIGKVVDVIVEISKVLDQVVEQLNRVLYSGHVLT